MLGACGLHLGTQVVVDERTLSNRAWHVEVLLGSPISDAGGGE